MSRGAWSGSNVEIDEATVTHAIAAYNAPNLRYVQGDALAIPLPDASVDVVVSFETLEHLRDQNRFLLETRRVLRPNGLFIVSTPDRLVYSAPGQAPNPYHLLELSVPEFTVLLERHFSQHRILAQRTAHCCKRLLPGGPFAGDVPADVELARDGLPNF